jgi:flagellar motor protein MotB
MSSIGDLMASLLFLFIITIVLFAKQLRDSRRKADEERVSITQQARGAAEARKQLLDRLKNDKHLAALQIKVDEEQGVLHLDESSVSFVTDKAVFEKGSEENVRRLARALAVVLPCYSAKPATEDACTQDRSPVLLEAVFIEGHTDQRRRRGRKDNWQLSAERAIQTYKTLLDEREMLKEIKNPSRQPLLSVSGYADSRPAHEKDSSLEEQYRQDRRIDLRFIMAPYTPTPTAPGEEVEQELERTRQQ